MVWQQLIMNNPFKLDTKTALVTGASSGLGREFAKVLAGAGANVVAAARRLPKLQETADIVRRDVGAEVYCLELDVNMDAQIVEALQLQKLFSSTLAIMNVELHDKL